MKPMLRRSLLALAIPAALLVAFHLEEDLRGPIQWSRWLATQKATGRNFDRTRLIPPAVPDAENFATAPGVAEQILGTRSGNWAVPEAFMDPRRVGGWAAGLRADYPAWKAELKGQDLEEFLKSYDSALDLWVAAAKRPRCRLLLNYGDASVVPALLGMRGMARVLRARALVRLQKGHSELALEDVQAGLAMVRHFQDEPHLLSQLLRLAWAGIYMQPVWEGLVDHAWNEAQLARLEADLARIDLIGPVKTSWQFERLNGLAPWDGRPDQARRDWIFLKSTLLDPIDEAPRGRLARWGLRLLVPGGWVYQDLLSTDRGYKDLDPVLDPAAHRVHADLQDQVLQRLARNWRTPSYRSSGNILQTLANQNIRVARAQTSIDLARIACALERHRLAKGGYPAELQSLVPAFLPGVPVDVVTGQPLHYARAGASFTLYSVGWNRVDEGGHCAPVNAQGVLSNADGDWVWYAQPQPVQP